MFKLFAVCVNAYLEASKASVDVTQAELTPYMLGYLGGNPRFTPPRPDYVARTRHGIGTGKYD